MKRPDAPASFLGFENLELIEIANKLEVLISV